MQNFRTGKIKNCIDKWIAPTTSGAAGADFTMGFKISAPCDFYAVRIHFFNGSAGTPTLSACVAATESPFITAGATNGYNALTAAENSSQPIVGATAYKTTISSTVPWGWRDLTFTDAGTSTMTAGTQFAPTILSSDIMPLLSVPRVDDATKPPMLLVRVRAATGLPFSGSANFAGMGAASAANRGRLLQTFDVSGNAVATKTTDIASPGSNYVVPMAVEYFSASRGSTVMAIGDSLTDGSAQLDDTANNRLTSWGFRACADISTLENPVGYINCGQSSQTSATFFAEGLREITKFKPSVVFYPVFSPNDFGGIGVASTADNVRAAMIEPLSRVARLLDTCAENDITAVLWTAIPYNATNKFDTLTKDAVRQALNAATLNRRNVVVADFNSIISNNESGSVQTFKTAYTYGDNVHFNAAGHEALATTVVRQALALALNINAGGSSGLFGNILS